MITYHSSALTANRLALANKAGDTMSIASGMASIAPSLVINDFNGKKARIIQTLKQVDDLKSGVVKTVIFKNLLECLDVEVDATDLAECQKKLGLMYQGVPYIRYEIVMRQMHYDNHSEKWTIRTKNDDGDTLSVIAEKTRGISRGKVGLRQSFEAVRAKPNLQRESLRKALRGSA